MLFIASTIFPLILISNLVEDVYISTHGRGIPETLENMFYPIENTKEAYRAKTIEIEKEKAHDEF